MKKFIILNAEDLTDFWNERERITGRSSNIVDLPGELIPKEIPCVLIYNTTYYPTRYGDGITETFEFVYPSDFEKEEKIAV